MCGRFAVTLPSDAMAQLFAAQPANDLPKVPQYNVCPTTQVHAVRPGEDSRRLVSMRWGFLPHWYKTENGGPLLINARAETVAEKPAFRAACRSRRCLVPATGFYEWTKDEQGARLPWYITRRDGAPIAFAGIWQSWEARSPEATAGGAVDTCAIITTAANSTMKAIHHRMPLVLEPEDWPLWLGEEGRGAAKLMQPGAEDVLEFYRVDPAVNSNRASGPELIEPFEEDDPAAE
ncbi:SOS response-associated peptidase [Cribrihabitans neustonicus]|uniref:SOS response-associated peptidase n=1 Tax=Cribrihabitans neustonicus TaxID=1429085 RepID=UPI003B5A5F88